VEQIIVEIPDLATGKKLKAFLKELNVKYSISAEDNSISDEEKEYVIDVLNNTLEEDYVSYNEVKNNILKKLPPR